MALGATLTQQVKANLHPVPVVLAAPVTLPISFDGTTSVRLLSFNGTEGSSVQAGPAGGTGKSLKIFWSAGEGYAGAFVTTVAIPFAADHKTITARVYSPKADIRMVLKVEGANGLSSAEYDATPAVVVGWQTLTWVAAGLDLGKTYTQVTLLPNLGTVDAAPGQAFYVDDVKLVADTVVAPPPTDYLALVADSISLVNGPGKTVYTMGQFESEAGIHLAWPIPSPMLMKVQLSEVGNFTLPADLRVSAAVSITETAAGGKSEVQAYIDNVAVKKTAAGLEILVSTTSANALAYTVSSDGKKKLVIDFGTGAAGVGNTLTTAANMTNSLVFGEVVQYAVNQISNDFTGIYALRGKYRMTVVLTGMPLRRADGSALPTLTVVVPTALNNTGGVTTSKTRTCPGLVGYLPLTG